jgi:hypothetical protein
VPQPWISRSFHELNRLAARFGPVVIAAVIRYAFPAYSALARRRPRVGSRTRAV